MKTSTLMGICLTLISLLLVLAAAFVFLFQGRLALQGQLITAQEENQTLHKKQAQTELDLSVAQATREATQTSLEQSVGARATAEQNSILLEGDLVQSQREVNRLSQEATRTATELNSASNTRTALEQRILAQQPVVEVVAPKAAAVLAPEQLFEMVVVAMNPGGLSVIEFLDGEKVIRRVELNGEVFASEQFTWKYEAVGEYTLRARMTDVDGIALLATPVAISVQLPATAVAP